MAVRRCGLVSLHDLFLSAPVGLDEIKITGIDKSGKKVSVFKKSDKTTTGVWHGWVSFDKVKDVAGELVDPPDDWDGETVGDIDPEKFPGEGSLELSHPSKSKFVTQTKPPSKFLHVPKKAPSEKILSALQKSDHPSQDDADALSAYLGLQQGEFIHPSTGKIGQNGLAVKFHKTYYLDPVTGNLFFKKTGKLAGHTKNDGSTAWQQEPGAELVKHSAAAKASLLKQIQGKQGAEPEPKAEPKAVEPEPEPKPEPVKPAPEPEPEPEPEPKAKEPVSAKSASGYKHPVSQERLHNKAKQLDLKTGQEKSSYGNHPTGVAEFIDPTSGVKLSASRSGFGDGTQTLDPDTGFIYNTAWNVPKWTTYGSYSHLSSEHVPGAPPKLMGWVNSAGGTTQVKSIPAVVVAAAHAKKAKVDLADVLPAPKGPYPHPQSFQQAASLQHKYFGFKHGKVPKSSGHKFYYPETGKKFETAQPASAYVDPESGFAYSHNTNNLVGWHDKTGGYHKGEPPSSLVKIAHQLKQYGSLDIPADGFEVPVKPGHDPGPEPVSAPSNVGTFSAPVSQPMTQAAETVVKQMPAVDVPKPEQLKKVVEQPHLAGAGIKTVYEGDDGEKWLHKLAIAKGGGADKPYSAAAQQAWANVARMIRPDHIPCGMVVMDGKAGTLQKFIKLDEKQPDLGGVHPKDLSDDDRKTIAGEHVLDWLMSQHDSHSQNFVRSADGKIYSIDKEQGFRFFGDDKLSTTYHPNAIHGEKPPYYNQLWEGFAQGQYDMDFDHVGSVLDKLDKITTQEYVKQLRPYAETLWPGKPAEQSKFLNTARRRKLDIRKQFEDFATELHMKKHGKPGQFTFAKGWTVDPKHMTDDGPKTVKKKYSAQQYLSVFNIEQGANVKLYPYTDPATQQADPTKMTIKIPKGSQGTDMIAKFLEHLGVESTTAPNPKGGEPISVLDGSQYQMMFVNKKDFDDALVERDEVVKTATETSAFDPAPDRPHYYSEDYDHPPAAANHATVHDVHKQAHGHSGSKISLDGPLVEHCHMKVRRGKDASGPYYMFQFKARPQLRHQLSSGSPSSMHQKTCTYKSDDDLSEEASQINRTISTRKWDHEGNEFHISPEDSTYSYMGMCWAKIRPKEDQTPAQAFSALMDHVKPGLSKDMMRDPTSEEKETWKLARLAWALAPEEHDKLSDEGKTAVKLKQILKNAGVSDEDIANAREEQVMPNHSTIVIPGRHKKLRAAGARFVMHGIAADAAAGVATLGCLGINERDDHGIHKATQSQTSDVSSGGADGVPGYIVTESGLKSGGLHTLSFHNQVQVLVDLSETDRTDTLLHLGDKYGCHNFTYNSAFKNRSTLDSKVKTLNSNWQHHEYYSRKGINPKKILRMVTDLESTRQATLNHMRSAGVVEVNGVPIEDFVVLMPNGNLKDAYEKYVKPTERE